MSTCFWNVSLAVFYFLNRTVTVFLHARSSAQSFEIHESSIDELGTDPVMVMNFVNRVGGTGKLAGTPKNVLFGSEDFGDTASGADILNTVGLGVIFRHPLEAAVGAFEGDVKTYQADIIVLKAYKGRPLNGIWATAPYLHNGSVPNLWELLKRPEERLKSFHVGSRKFDPVNVGFDTSADGSGTSILDTQLHANSNAGHLWGTQLTDAEKWDLVEYMKSL